MLELLGEQMEALLGVGQRHTGELFFFRIEVEVDVLTAEDLPLEATEVDLVLPKRTELGGCSPRTAGDQEQCAAGQEKASTAGCDESHHPV